MEDKKGINQMLNKLNKQPTATNTVSPNFNKSHSVRPQSDGKQLVIGKNIKISGAIDVCESLVVEGQLEANIKDAKVLDIVPGGVFKGEAEVDQAYISGLFDGTISARNVYVYNTGEIKGKLNYTNLIVEQGGIIKGSIKYSKTPIKTTAEK